MHDAALAFLQRVRNQHPRYFNRARVLECGSYAINGSPRGLFRDCDYVGMDWRPGPGVDVVGLVHQYETDKRFDLIVSTEMLEHDPFWENSLHVMVNLLAPGGALALTWASPERKRHEVDCAPEEGYYAGRAAYEVLGELEPLGGWYTIKAATLRGGLDCQLLAIRPTVSVIIPTVGQVALANCAIQEAKRLAGELVEFVLVDNGSTPAESERLTRLGADVLVHVEQPVGYAAAINRGVRASHGKYLFLLNNDAWPTRQGWDTRLISVLENVPAAALAVPTASRCYHPDQRAHGPKPDDAQLVETNRVAFVAAMLRRETYDAIGPLDERFGAGNYEDDDYCRRLTDAGGRILIDPATYCFHVGSVTMSTLDYDALMARNRQIFEEKWSDAKTK